MALLKVKQNPVLQVFNWLIKAIGKFVCPLKFYTK